MSRTKWIAMGLVAALAGAAANAAAAGDRDPGERRRGGRGALRHGQMRHGHDRRADGRVDGGAFRENSALGRFEASKPTDDQRRAVLSQAKSAQAFVESSRDQARQILAEAWAQSAKASEAGTPTDRKALRTSVREKIRALRESTRKSLEPMATQVIATLTPEQRTAIVASGPRRRRAPAEGTVPAAATGDTELTRLATRLVANRFTVAFLEARLGR